MKFFWKLIATGFGTGYSPVAPGTVGTLAGCLILLFLKTALPEQFAGGRAQASWQLLLAIGFLLLGIKSSREMEKEWGPDPQKVVADEIAGLWIAMIAVPVSLKNLAIAFVLFRIFDIWKPLGIRRMERLPGGWGVMMDDVLAGIYSCLLLHGWLYFSQNA
jgi:phosphatidylglycerophosphatase A